MWTKKDFLNGITVEISKENPNEAAMRMLRELDRQFIPLPGSCYRWATANSTVIWVAKHGNVYPCSGFQGERKITVYKFKPGSFDKYSQAALYILSSHTNHPTGMRFSGRFAPQSEAYNTFKEAGVLEAWFEPEYENSRREVGGFPNCWSISDDAVFLNGKNVTKPLRQLVLTYATWKVFDIKLELIRISFDGQEITFHGVKTLLSMLKF